MPNGPELTPFVKAINFVRHVSSNFLPAATKVEGDPEIGQQDWRMLIHYSTFAKLGESLLKT